MKPTPKTAPLSEKQVAKRAHLLRAVQTDAPSKLKLFRRVYAGKASPRQCIKAQCLHCCWHDIDAIRECTAAECLLWGLRPFQHGVKSEPACQSGAH